MANNGKGYTGYSYISRNGEEMMEFATEAEAYEYLAEEKGETE